MHATIARTLTALTVGGIAAAVALAPTVSAAGARADLPGHVNSNITVTRVYTEPTGSTFSQEVHACAAFTYDRIVNGRYHAKEYDGWISTDKAGPGRC